MTLPRLSGGGEGTFVVFAAALLAIVEGGYVLARVDRDAAAMAEAVEGGLHLLTAVSRPG